MRNLKDISHNNVSFKIYEFECASEELTKQLGISPTEVRVKGETRLVGKSNQSRIINKENIWILKSDLPLAARVEDHIANILNKMSSHEEQFIKVTNKFYTEFSCGLYFYETNPGIHLDNNLLKKLALLNTRIDLDMYCMGEAEDKK